MSSLRERLQFFRQFTKNLRNIGALFPSSPALAREMAAGILVGVSPCRVLEVGSGPGTITKAIVLKMRPQDTLWLVEINPEFCEELRKKFVHDPQPGWPKIRVFEGPLQSFQAEEAFDFVISSLPLNAFTPELIQDLWHCIRSLLKPGGILTFFEYWGVRALRHIWPGATERIRLAQVSKLFSMTISPVIERTVVVYANLPPAKVHTVEF